MKNKVLLITLVLISALIALSIIASSNLRSDSSKGQAEEEYSVDTNDFYQGDQLQDGDAKSLSDAEVKWLKQMREEEKLARDVYVLLGSKWGLQLFTNISASEETHTNAVHSLLSHYGITDPVKDNSVGNFTNSELQALYGKLVSKGEISPSDALMVGATIEDLDIRDLNLALAETQNEEIKVVYKNLQKGSRNHLRAFVRAIASSNGVYAPQYIDRGEYDAIITTPQEKGRLR